MKKYNENYYLNYVLPIAQQVGCSVPYELFIEMINPKLRGNHWIGIISLKELLA
jgi:hypothetical protein